METKELIEVETEDGIVSVNLDNVPAIIAGRITDISNLEKQVRSAEVSANKAMDYVGSQMRRYKVKGKWIFRHRAGKTKDILGDTQRAVEEMAKSQQVSVDAIKQSFEFQKKLAETSKYLFNLGCANITANRTVVRAIEAKLNGASKEEISELAWQEFNNVLYQLKEQEDMLKRQDTMESQIFEHESRLAEKDILDSEQSKLLEEHAEQLKNKDEIDREQSRRLEELDALLENKDLVDEKQENAISANKLAIERNAEAIKVLFEYTKQKDVLDSEQSKEIERLRMTAGSKQLSILTLIISGVAIVLSGIAIALQFATFCAR